MILCVILGCIQNADQVVALQMAAGSVAAVYEATAVPQQINQPDTYASVKTPLSFQPLKT